MMAWLQVALDLFGGNPAPADAARSPSIGPGSRPGQRLPGTLASPPRKTLRTKKAVPKGPRGTPIWQLPVLSDADLVLQGSSAPPVLAPVASSAPAPEPAMGSRVVLPTPNVLSHSEATHRIRLQTHDTGFIDVAYRLERAKRRSIGFLVSEEGLVLKAPRWVGMTEIAQALQQKASWILRKLSEVQVRAEHALTQRIVWENGGQFQFLGETITLVLDPSHARQNGQTQLLSADAACPYARLQLHVPHGASPSQIRDAAKAWLLRQAKQLFTERLNHFAPQLGVRWTRLTLSNAGTRWGSAKVDGSIRLHWRLIHFKPSIIDYVVVHELSHLRVMDHSPRFWDTVATLVPDYAAQRKHLRTQHLPKWE